MSLITLAAVVGVIAYGIAFYRDVINWRRFHDRRAKRETYIGFALLIEAGATMVALMFAALDAPVATEVYRLVIGVAIGSFAAGGVLMALDAPHRGQSS